MLNLMFLLWAYYGPMEDPDTITLESIQFYYGWEEEETVIYDQLPQESETEAIHTGGFIVVPEVYTNRIWGQ